MTPEKSHLFISYSRLDIDRVRPIVDAIKDELDFRALPIDLWMDTSNLLPGEQWEVAIADALRASVGFIFFLSPRSLQSDWVRREVTVAAGPLDRLIIPVILHRPLEVPAGLAERQWIDLSGRPTRKQIKIAAAQIAGVVESYLKKTDQPKPALSKQEVPKLADDLAHEFRASTEPGTTREQKTSVFVVHGHNAEALAKLEEWLAIVRITAVVLSREDESPQSLFQKFMSVANKAQFAIVLLCADDYGASRIQYEAANVADKALQFRARQNVILELGFFYGRLGWENVFVLYQEPDRVFPNFERPSDLDGVVFDAMTGRTWKRRLEIRLSQAGFQLSLPNREF
jgi:predicted nucleotide-binding protein